MVDLATANSKQFHPMDTGGDGIVSAAVTTPRRELAGPRQGHVTGGFSVASSRQHPPSANSHDAPTHHPVAEGALSGPPTELSISEASSWVLKGGKNDREG